MLGAKLSANEYLARAARELSKINPVELESLAGVVDYAYRERKFVFVVGNGGSGSNASHLCEDLGKCTLRPEDYDADRPRLRILSLTDNTRIHHGMGQRRRLRARVCRATQELGVARRRAHRHQRLRQ